MTQQPLCQPTRRPRRTAPLLRFVWFFVAFASSIPLVAASAGADLTENLLMSSKILGYDLQYRVFTPAGTPQGAKLPVIYLTDGQWYLEPGGFDQVLEELIDKGQIEPVVAVFVDSRDPHNLDRNRRNAQFFCDDKYVNFFEQELVPTIDSMGVASTRREDRVILGLSFGGLNSACFGLMANKTFGGIGMQSPAIHPVPSMHESWQNEEHLPLRIFLSSGTKGDNETSTRHLRDILEGKGYDLRYIEVPFGHEWKNWQPLLDDVLTFFFAAD